MSSRTVDTLPRRPAATLRFTAARAVLGALCLLAFLSIPDAARGEGGRWQWPLPPPHQVVRPFEAPDHPYGPGHRGIDIAGSVGAPVAAVEGGTVRFAGDVAERGVVSVLHADGLISTYEPVEARIQQGEVVAAGDRLGVLAEGGASSSHCETGVCLHLGARQGQQYLDPLLLLGARGPSVLLPWTGDTGTVSGAPPASLGAAASVTAPRATGAARPVPAASNPAGPLVALIE